MNKVPAKGPVTKGIDVSRWQKPVNWAAEKASGVEWMFAKASEGTHSDVAYREHITSAKNHGLMVGAYHFFHPTMDPKIQAARFMASALATGIPLDLPLCIDWETTDGAPAQSDREAGLVFLQEIEARGHKAMIYTGPYFGQALQLDHRFQKYPLWIAHYKTSAPLIPAPWQDWIMWQYSGTSLDFDVYNGSVEDLRALKGLS